MVDEYLHKLCSLDAVDCGWISVPGIRRALLDGSTATQPASADASTLAEPTASKPASAYPAATSAAYPAAADASTLAKPAASQSASSEPAASKPSAIAASSKPAAPKPASA